MNLEEIPMRGDEEAIARWRFACNGFLCSIGLESLPFEDKNALRECLAIMLDIASEWQRSPHRKPRQMGEILRDIAEVVGVVEELDQSIQRRN